MTYTVTSVKWFGNSKDTRVTGTSNLELTLSVLKDCGYEIVSIVER